MHAGLDAGRAYNTFPLMGGRWFPEEYWRLPSALANLFENTAAVQVGLCSMFLYSDSDGVCVWRAVLGFLGSTGGSLACWPACLRRQLGYLNMDSGDGW